MGVPRYGVARIRPQMQGGYLNGIRRWILWNPESGDTFATLHPRILAASDESHASGNPE